MYECEVSIGLTVRGKDDDDRVCELFDDAIFLTASCSGKVHCHAMWTMIPKSLPTTKGHVKKRRSMVKGIMPLGLF